MNRLYLLLLILILQIGGLFYVNQQHPTSRLRVEFLDIGQGDAILIETVNNKTILVDTGVDNRVVEKLNSHLQPLNNVIDYLVLTHSDSDHIGGLSGVLQNFEVKNIIYNFDFNLDNKTQKHDFDLIALEGSNISKVTAESDFNYDGCQINFVWPSLAESFANLSDNDSSISMILSYNGFDVFLGGDISTAVENKIIPIISPVEVMKLNHHGSNTGNSLDFIRALNPQLTVISVGKNNSYHLPNSLVLERLGQLNIKILRTDNDGDITCEVVSEKDYNCSPSIFKTF